jgi:hypothetical protein
MQRRRREEMEIIQILILFWAVGKYLSNSNSKVYAEKHKIRCSTLQEKSFNCIHFFQKVKQFIYSTFEQSEYIEFRIR